MTRAECSVDGCARPRKYRLYCNAHQDRLRRNGHPGKAEIAKLAVVAPGQTCSVVGCGSRPQSRGLCGMHYQRVRLHGVVGPAETVVIVGEIDRFWSKVDKNGPPPEERPDLGPCWLWTGSLDHGGYGWFKADGRMQRAHRWAYRQFVGDVAADDEVDHLCRVRSCVNFEDHLEVVTPMVNSYRSLGNATKTHCDHGHPFSETNTYHRPDGGRRCRICLRHSVARYRQRKLRSQPE